MSVHSVSMKGKRPQNEDKHNYILNLDPSYETYDPNKAPINYYAVYDGHGGKFVSTYLHEHLPICFMDKRMEYPLKKTFVKQIYSHWQNELKSKYFKYTENCGSTCLIVIHYKINNVEYLNVLNTGDSRCIMCRNNMGNSLSLDHKPGMPAERSRIEALGGKVTWDGFDYRVSDSLSVSRSFGDFSVEPYVTAYPDIYKYKLTNNDKFIVLMCDGVTDVLSNDEIVNFVLDNCYDMRTEQRINKNINIAKKLAQHAIQKGSTDNVTCIIVFFD